MQDQDRELLLGPILKSVSRSFYLTLRVLPAGLRDPMALGYLLARIADTIADTSLIPSGERLELLLSLRSQVNGMANSVALTRIATQMARQPHQSDEKVLLESLGSALTMLSEMPELDRVAIQDVVSTLTEGMVFDLRTFPDEASGEIVALQTLDDLDRYTYLVAGCVGEFWTRMTYSHLPGTLKEDPQSLMARGVRFGKALQMTNVLRDCSKDLRIGRCYIPSTILERDGLQPMDLLKLDASLRARPILFELVQLALDHFREAVEYTLAIPAFSIRLRLACLWPILIGIETLLLLVNNDDWLVPTKVSKIARRNVYGVMLRSLPMVVSDRMMRASARRIIAKIEERLATGSKPQR